MAPVLRTLISRAGGLVVAALFLLALAVPAGASPEKVAGGIRFTYHDLNATSVSWAGLFNNWSTTANPMQKDDKGEWSVVVALPAGDQQYKFVVDGQWFADPENGVTAGEFGNSVVKVAPNGGLVAQTATSNTAYSPKITINGRDHTLFQEIYDAPLSRFELSRPLFDIDLGVAVRATDLLKANILMNINPEKEDVQDYRSRLNWKRGSLEFQQPDLRLFAFESETVPTWDDPARLVGNIGIYGHDFGYNENGFQVTTPKFGFDTQVIYADNSTVGGTEFPGGSDFFDFTVDRGTNRKIQFLSGTPARTAVRDLMRIVRVSPTGFAIASGTAARVSLTDDGDGGHSFGFGDGATNTFAASVRRALPGGLRVGALGRSDRGFHLGRMVLAEATGDSTYTLTYGQTEQQSFAGGGEARWSAGSGIELDAEFLSGARRMDLMDRGHREYIKATSINGIIKSDTTLSSTTPLGQHYNMDTGSRMIVGGTWTLAKGDVVVSAELERQTHRYPSWLQPSAGYLGVSNPNHVQFENVDFQQGQYASSAKDIENSMTEVRLRWDRNWRYYVGREVKTSIRYEQTTFKYDARTAWEYQLWFPTGNFWLQQNGQQVGTDRLTVLGETHAFRLRPSVEIPIRAARNIVFRYQGDFTGAKFGLLPRYAESIFQAGFDLTPKLRFTDDTRWVKYNAPALRLFSGYTSTFAEFTYKFAEGVHIGLGWGVSPNVIDPVTNEFAPIGRDVYLSERNANGYIAENNWMSLGPQIASAEHKLQTEHRIQFEAVVHF